jgi:ABC-type Mn2+/Zn2+ transport system permease subunit
VIAKGEEADVEWVLHPFHLITNLNQQYVLYVVLLALALGLIGCLMLLRRLLLN